MLSLKLLLKVLVPLLLIAAAFIVGWFCARRAPQVPPGTYHAGLAIDRVTELAELLVVKFDVTDVVVTSLQGRTGGVQVVLLVKGDVSLGIDVAAAQFREVDCDNRTAVLALPPPTASRPRLDHTRTRIVLLRKEGLWQLSPGPTPYAAATDQALSDAQALVNVAGTTVDADHRARSHAEQVLQAFFKSIEWRVSVRWSDVEKPQ
ncbi:MAG TPA: DUF4230 domain-containing protein [Roseimicrobium sp.]|nr:DUF4230 domain-containing protein [Roseimicrobium sp.]